MNNGLKLLINTTSASICLLIRTIEVFGIWMPVPKVEMTQKYYFFSSKGTKLWNELRIYMFLSAKLIILILQPGMKRCML